MATQNSPFINICIVYLCTLLSQSVYSQPAGSFNLSLKVDLDNQPSRVVLDAQKDNLGYFWMMTYSGLYRYNGESMETLKELSGNPSLKYQLNNFQRFYKLNDSILLIGEKRIDDELQFLDLYDYSLERLQITKNLDKDEMVIKLLQNEDDELYLITQSTDDFKLYKINYHMRRLEKQYAFNFPNKVDIADLHLSMYNDVLWTYSSEGGIRKFSGGGKKENELVFYSDTFRYNLTFFQFGKNGNLYMGSDSFKGVYTINEKGDKVHPVLSLPKLSHYTYIWEDEIGNLIFGNAQTFRKLDNLYLLDTSSQVTTLSNILNAENRILNINGTNFKDYIFTSTYFGYYCFKYSKSTFKTLLEENIAEGEFGKIMRGILKIPHSDTLVIAREVNRWYTYDLSENALSELPLIDKSTQDTLYFECCFDLVYGRDGFLYSSGCLDELDEFRLFKIDLKTGLTESFPVSDVIQSISYDNDSLLYLSTGKSFRSTSPSTFITFNIYSQDFTTILKSEQLNNKLIRFQLKIDSLIWLGTKDGLYKYNTLNSSLTTIPLYIGKNSNSIRLEPDIISLSMQDSILCIGTRGDGLILYNVNNNNFTILSISDGLLSNIISSISQYDKYLILGTGFGLSIYNRMNKEFYNYFENDGISNNEFNRFSAYHTGKGIFYLGTINGLTIFNLQDLIRDLKSDSIYIDKIKISNAFTGENVLKRSAVFDKQTITFSPFVNSIEIYFNTPILIRRSITYKVKYGSQANNWNNLTSKNSFTINRNKPGTYPLKVNAVNSFGGSQFDQLNLTIVFKPRFYELWYFWLVLGLLFCTGIILYLRYRYKNMKNERNKSMQRKMEMAEFELKALRAQMNPHFIFNAITAIQYYIMNNDSAKAEHFLSRFGKLMRNILENSRHLYIELMEEVKFLENYTILERLRFHEKFQYKYEVSDRLREINPKIPSMLLQPFIENAINHGIYHLEDRTGILKFNAYIEEEELIIIISDNGIGRKKAKEIVYRRKKKHKSRATQIIDERLESLRLFGYTISYEVIDLYKDKEAAGTKVKLSLPLRVPQYKNKKSIMRSE